MILAIDIGNTNIVVGCIDDKKTYFIERLSTVRTKTELEYAVDLKTVLDIYHIKKTDIEGCIISSVVPQITNIAKLAAEKILKKEVMVLGPGVKTGLNIMMDNPGQLGADLVANAVAGLNEYPVPFIVIDMGTATTVSVVNDKKQYIGGMIMPGVGVSLDALTARASQLSGISIDAPKHVLGKNTIECMKSGVLYSHRSYCWICRASDHFAFRCRKSDHSNYEKLFLLSECGSSDEIFWNNFNKSVSTSDVCVISNICLQSRFVQHWCSRSVCDRRRWMPVYGLKI